MTMDAVSVRCKYMLRLARVSVIVDDPSEIVNGSVCFVWKISIGVVCLSCFVVIWHCLKLLVSVEFADSYRLQHPNVQCCYQSDESHLFMMFDDCLIILDFCVARLLNEFHWHTSLHRVQRATNTNVSCVAYMFWTVYHLKWLRARSVPFMMFLCGVVLTKFRNVWITCNCL